MNEQIIHQNLIDENQMLKRENGKLQKYLDSLEKEIAEKESVSEQNLKQLDEQEKT